MADTITVTGVVATPPTKGTAAGTPVCNFRLASGLRRFDREQGRWIEYGTNWYSVAAYRYLASNVSESISKGDRIIVRGRLRVKEWENSGGKGMALDLDAESIGHDLTWGTSSFTRHSRRDAETQTEEPEDIEGANDEFVGSEAAPPFDWHAAQPGVEESVV